MANKDSTRMWPYSFLMLTEIALLRFQRTQSQCTIVVIFGLKRAECMDKGLVTIPRSLPIEINVLAFTGNFLTKLDMDDFRLYHSLQEIQLVRNRINSVAPDAFRGLHNLQILDLQGNKLTAVPSDAFRHLPSVRILVLKSNPIRYLTSDCFQGLPNIEVLNFENCWLERVHPHAFRGLDKLNEINLVNNELRGLNANMVDFLPHSLTIVRLYRNPWNCDCRLRWLRRWLTLGSVNWYFASNSPTCSEPKLLSDISWRHLGWERFACPSVIVNTVSSVRIQLGTNASVDCVVLGDPEPVIVWTHNAKPVLKSTVATNYEANDVGDKQVRSSIVIKNATRRDMGDYKCAAENSAGRSEVTYKVWTEEEEAISLLGNLTVGRLRREEIVLLGVSVGTLILLVFVVVVIALLIRRKQTRKQSHRIHNLKPIRGDKNNGRNVTSDSGDSIRSSRENTLVSETGSTALLESVGEDCEAGLMPLHYRSPLAAKKLPEPTDDTPGSDAIASRCLQKFFSRLKDRKASDSPPKSPIDVWFIKTESGGQCEFTPDILRCEQAFQSLQTESDCLPTILEDDDVDDEVTSIFGDYVNCDDSAAGGFGVALASVGTRLSSKTMNDATKCERADNYRTKLGVVTSFDALEKTSHSYVNLSTKVSTATASFDGETPGEDSSTENMICDETNSDPLMFGFSTASDPRPRRPSDCVLPTATDYKDTLTTEPGDIRTTTSSLNSNRSHNIDVRATIADKGSDYRPDTRNKGTLLRENAVSPGELDNATGFSKKSWDNVRGAIWMAPRDKDVQSPDFETTQHVRDINSDSSCDYESGVSSRLQACEEQEEENRSRDAPKQGQRDAFGTTV